jgi:hypothetical protein
MKSRFSKISGEWWISHPSCSCIDFRHFNFQGLLFSCKWSYLLFFRFWIFCLKNLNSSQTTSLFIKNWRSINIFKFTRFKFLRCMDNIKILIVLFLIISFLQSCSNLLICNRILRNKLLFMCLLIFTVKIWLLIIT